MVAVRHVPLVLHVLWQLPAECHRFLQQSARRNAPGDLSADSLGSSIAKRMLGAALFDSVADHGISICGSDIAVQLLVTAVCHWLIEFSSRFVFQGWQRPAECQTFCSSRLGKMLQLS